MDGSHALRHLDGTDTYGLHPGDPNLRSYVGPPDQYDVMGATQFALLAFLGLRETHAVLDFGCGSLRAGRLLIPYLLPGRYHGIDPNGWLIEDGIERHVGRDQLARKRPQFLHTADGTVDGFGTRFDVILAQSVFSHAGRDLVARSLASFRANLAPEGMVVATFMHLDHDGAVLDFTGSGWIYPDCVSYTEDSVRGFFAAAGLSVVKLAWHHPRQTWYVGTVGQDAGARAAAIAPLPGFHFTAPDRHAG